MTHRFEVDIIIFAFLRQLYSDRNFSTLASHHDKANIVIFEDFALGSTMSINFCPDVIIYRSSTLRQNGSESRKPSYPQTLMQMQKIHKKNVNMP